MNKSRSKARRYVCKTSAVCSGGPDILQGSNKKEIQANHRRTRRSMFLCYLYTFTRKRRTIPNSFILYRLEKGEPFWPAHRDEFCDLTMQNEIIQLQLHDTFKKSSIKKSCIAAGVRHSSRRKYE